MYNNIKKWKGDAKKMLLNFKMENFRSFKDETFFTMLSSKQKTHNDYVIDKSVNGNKLRVLPMTVIYGANACGKSNIVLAMDILKKMVMKGTLNCKELEPYKSMLSFIRDTSWYDPVSLEITFSTQNNIYRYGIKFTDIDVYKIEEAEEMYNKLKESLDIQIKYKNVQIQQEFHIACMIFNQDNEILIHKDSERGLEFGCIKKIFGIGSRTWEKICVDGYKDKYNLNIKVESCPIPIATYYYEKGNAVGLIIMAEYSGNSKDLNCDEWKFMSIDEIKKYNENTVENFKENAKKGIQLRGKKDK